MFGFVLLMRGSLCGILLLLQPAAGEIVIAEFRALLDDNTKMEGEANEGSARNGKKK